MEILLNESTMLKIEYLIEEASLFNKMQDKIQEYFDKIEKKLSTKGEIERMLKKEKEAKKRREDYLKENNIDLSQVKKDIKAGKDFKVSLKQVFAEIKADSKNIGGPEAVKILVGIVIIIVAHLSLEMLLLPFGLSSTATLIISGTIIAPLVEEIFKRLTVRKGQSFLGYATLVGIETGFKLSTGNPGYALDGILIHGIATLKHVQGKIKDDYKKDLNIKDNPNEFKNASSKFATILHSLSNMIPIIKNGLLKQYL